VLAGWLVGWLVNVLAHMCKPYPSIGTDIFGHPVKADTETWQNLRQTAAS